ncbi:MAG: SMC-Scp complex subunit ScpB [Anaerolineae bacterium]
MVTDLLTDAESPARASEALSVLIESLLFVAAEPLTLARLAAVLLVEPTQVEGALSELDASLVGRGLRLQRKNDLVQLTTLPSAAPVIERLLGLDTNPKLSPAALETLAMIAYRQPVTRTQLEAIRGVNCDGVIRTLLSRSLIEEQGRLDAVGRPILYGTTFEFLQYFSLNCVEDLPPLPEAIMAELAARDAQAVTVADETTTEARAEVDTRRPTNEHGAADHAIADDGATERGA